MKNKFELLRNLVVILFLGLKSPFVFAWGWNEFQEEAPSPLTTDAKYILITGGVLTLAASLTKDRTIIPVQDWFQEKKPLGEWSKYGDYMGQLIPNGLYMMGQGIAGYNGNGLGYKRAIGMLKATAYSCSVTTVLKYSVREPRPDNNQEKNSFPSGHTTSVFAFAGYVWAEHGWAWGVPAVTLATFTGASRIEDNRHFLNDVLAGAAIGMAFGYGISSIEKTDKITSINVVPLFQGDIKGIALVKEF